MAAELERYLEDKKVKAFLSNITKAVLVSQPDDPIEFLLAYIVEKFRPKPRIIIAGPPGSGKGTQAERIRAEFGIQHISSGQMLREEVGKGSDVGKQADALMKEGKLVPDDVLIPIVKNFFESVGESGYLLDGFPRTGAQAKALAEIGIVPDLLVVITVPDDVLVERITGRRMDKETGAIYHLKYNPPPADVPPERLEQRADDSEETLRERLKVYHEHIAAITAAFNGRVLEIGGDASPDDVWTMMRSELYQAAQARK